MKVSFEADEHELIVIAHIVGALFKSSGYWKDGTIDLLRDFEDTKTL